MNSGPTLTDHCIHVMSSGHCLYSTNGQHVYVHTVDEDAVIPGVDLRTFAVLEDDYYVTDARHVFYLHEMLPGADPSTFSPIPGGSYGKDASHVYWRWRLVSNADPKTFQSLQPDYAKDRSRVYNAQNIVAGADSQSFVVDGQSTFCDTPGSEPGTTALECYYDAHDRNHKYLGGTVVD